MSTLDVATMLIDEVIWAVWALGIVVGGLLLLGRLKWLGRRRLALTLVLGVPLGNGAAEGMGAVRQ